MKSAGHLTSNQKSRFVAAACVLLFLLPVTVLHGASYAHTQPATLIGPSEATLNGTVVSNGLESLARFEWGTNTNYSQVEVRGILRVATQPAWRMSADSAILNGMVLPNGFSTMAWFEWGRTAATYGQTTAPLTANDEGIVVRIAETITNLAPGIYHFRMVASNATGVVYGPDKTFTTGNKVAAWGYNLYPYGQASGLPGLDDAVSVAGGWVHSVALRNSGAVVAWGYNYSGETNVPASATNVVALSADDHHSLALRANGTVVAWGWKFYGGVYVPNGLSNVVATASGADHDLALRSDGTVVTWGQYGYNEAVTPVGLSNVIAVAAAGNRSLALRADGTVVTWGDNYSGWLTPPAGLSNVIDIATGSSHSLALRSDGTVVGWGDGSAGQTNVPAGLSNIIAIATRGAHSLALRSDNSVVGWGYTNLVTNMPPGLTNVGAIGAGGLHALVVAANVSPVASNQTVIGSLNQDLVIALSGTDANSDALSHRVVSLPARGSLYQYAGGVRGALISAGSWVSDAQGRIIFAPSLDGFGEPYATFNFVANDGGIDSTPATVSIIVRGATAAFPLAADRLTKTSGELNGVAVAGHLPSTAWFEWGQDRNYGQATTPIPLSAGSNLVWLSEGISGLTPNQVYHCRLVVSNSGGVAMSANRVFTTGRKPTFWGRPYHGEANVPAGLTNVVAVAPGGGHVLALNNNGTLAMWGDNFYQQLNIPATATNFVAISAGQNHSLVLRADGSVVAWGSIFNGQTNMPAGLTDIKAIAAGGAHNLALRSNGTVVAWGWNQYGQTNVPAGLSGVVAIAAGDYHSLALKADGRVVAWGSERFGYGQTNVPPWLVNVVDIWGNCCQSRAIRIDGSVVAWGNTNVQADWTSVLQVAGLLALKSDNTVSSELEGGNFGLDDIPSGLSDVASIGVGAYYAEAIGNTPPVARAVTSLGPANHDLIVQLSGSDSQEDDLNFRIASLPSAGVLYQYVNGGRGSVINLANTPVTDVSDRVVFAPAADGTGSPFAAFAFIANDGRLDSTQAVATVSIIGQPYAVTQAAAPIGPTNAMLNAMVVPNGFDTTAWFEWGNDSSYGQTTLATNLGAGPRVIRISMPVEALASNSVVHFRVVASNAVGVAVGAERLLTTGQRLSSWGGNEYGQTNVSPWLRGVTDVFADSGTSYALTREGLVTAFGHARTNVLSAIPSGLSNVVAIGQGIALKADGTITVWGSNLYGQTNVPPGLSNIIAIAASDGLHRLALRADGTVVAWGYNNFGQTNVPVGLSNVVAISSGNWFSAALKADGTVVAWGGNRPVETNVPPDLTNAVAITSGSFHSLAITSDRRVVMWGDNSNGSQNASVPPEATNVVAVACGYFHNVALRADGSLVTWGFNVQGSVAPQAGLSNVVGMACGTYHSVVLRPNRPPTAVSIAASGVANRDLMLAPYGSDPDGDATVVRVMSLPVAGNLYQAIGSARGQLITSTNTLVTGSGLIYVPAANGFGSPYDSFTYLASDLEEDSSPATATISISGTPFAASLAPIPIMSTGAILNGMVVANGLPTLAWFEWGTNSSYGQTFGPVAVDGAAESVFLNQPLSNLTVGDEYHFRVIVSNAVRVIATPDRVFRTSGRVGAWGQNQYGATNAPAELFNVVDVAAGRTHGLALRNDGTVKAWGGANLVDYPGGLTNVPNELSNVVAVAAGDSFSVALKADGKIAAWGGYQYYFGAETNVPATASNVIAIACGASHGLALRANGTIVGWGYNSYGQAGVPANLRNVVAIAAGRHHSLALRINGTVTGWGYNASGQLNIPAALSNVTAIAAGDSHSLALRADGTVAAWGSGSAINVPSGLNGVTAIAAGASHSFALRNNGVVVGWGDNFYGQQNVPAAINPVIKLSARGYLSVAWYANTRPQSNPVLAYGPVNSDLVVQLSGADVNGDPLTYRVVSLPMAGALFQYDAGTRGPAILSANTVVTDSLRKLIFAPAANELGNPYTSFGFVASDGELDSFPGLSTIYIVLPTAPHLSGAKSVLHPGGPFEINFSGQTGATYRVWTTTNLTDWDVLGTALGTSNGWFQFFDFGATNAPHRFYRAGAP